MRDTSKDSAPTAGIDLTPQDDLDATSAIPLTLTDLSSLDCAGVKREVCFQPTRPGGQECGEHWLTQRGWEASMDLPPLTWNP